MDCKNCGHHADGNYCSHCGQSTQVDEVNFSNLVKDLTASIFQVDKGFFYTLKGLFKRPGQTLRAFLDGKRKQHFKPVAYLLTLSTIYFLASKLTGQNTWLGDIINGFIEGLTDDDPQAEIPAILTWIVKNYAYTNLLLLPIFSLASYLSFRKLSRNYIEHLVINSYLTGQQAIFYTLFAIIIFLTGQEKILLLALLLSVAYTFWVFWQFFDKGNRLINLLRSLMTYVLYLIFSVVTFLLIVSLVTS